MFDMKGFVLFLISVGAVIGCLSVALVRWLYAHLSFYWT